MFIQLNNKKQFEECDVVKKKKKDSESHREHWLIKQIKIKVVK